MSRSICTVAIRLSNRDDQNECISVECGGSSRLYLHGTYEEMRKFANEIIGRVLSAKEDKERERRINNV